MFGFEAVVKGSDDVIEHAGIDLVVITTPHNTHADLVTAALERGTAVYVEKPLALDWDEFATVRAAHAQTRAPLFVGFNRRYAPLAEDLRTLPSPKLMAYRVNAGQLPSEHWTNDLARGGGRLKGEGCHFIDFLCDQAQSDPTTVVSRGFRSAPGLPLAATDNFSVQITFADGSVGVVHYAADSPTGPGKERFETSSPGAYAVIDDFKRATVWNGAHKRKLGTKHQDKGFAAQFRRMADVLARRAEPPLPESYYLSTLTTLAAARSLETGRPEMVVEAAELPSPPKKAAAEPS
jgi:predicted dehydrogenase